MDDDSTLLTTDFDQPPRGSRLLGSLRTDLPLPTLGGAQFWSDELFFHGWHIQRHARLGHCRLLDAGGIRRARGSWEYCRERLAEFVAKSHAPPMSGKAVIVMHGLLRSARGMRGLARYLAREGGYTTFNVNYPSTRLPIAAHAASLASILRHLEGIEEIHFVCHSLGNLVVRHYLADCLAAKAATGQANGPAMATPAFGDAAPPAAGSLAGPDPRLRRMVMLGPPNRGASIAEWLSRVDPFKLLGAAHEIRDWSTLESRLVAPEIEFGVIAGGRGQTRGYNPLLTGDNDLIVTVESTRLAGATDFRRLPVLHTLMMDDPRVRAMTLRFLRNGYFTAAEERQAIVS